MTVHPKVEGGSDTHSQSSLSCTHSGTLAVRNMNTPPHSIRKLAALAFLILSAATLATGKAQDNQDSIPAPLLEWKDWALWGAPAQVGPQPFDNGDVRLHAWPTELALQATSVGGNFAFKIRVYHESWVALPGNNELWPQDVLLDGQPIPVLSRNGLPTIRLKAGDYQVTGTFQWEQVPQRIAIPESIGILTLSIDNRPVEIPDWDAAGFVWLKRAKAGETDRQLVSAQVYRLIEDGIPMWLRTEIELSVTGRSREEDLGTVLPEGWQLAAVDSPIPTAVDNSGRMKAQVRAGKWRIRLDAFRTEPAPVFRFAANARPITDRELIALKPAPELRVVEIRGLQAVDVSQTTFPEPWRTYPVYAWETDKPFELEERMRGMGSQRPEGLTIGKELWLDQDGKNLTWQDKISGQAQRIWRLNVAEGRDLGAVKVDGDSQLITLAPGTNSPGVEVRRRNLDMEAVGRAAVRDQLPATGWQADADSLRGTLHLPPGWRVFALFGAEWVQGDWLTAWSLLDLFLLLVFSMAIGRVWGIGAGVLAFCGFVLAFHEPGAPRFSWILLLIPLLLLRVVPGGRFRRILQIWKTCAIALLALVLIPFVAGQIQSVLYPQLERERPAFLSDLLFPTFARVSSSVEYSREWSGVPAAEPQQPKRAVLDSNLNYEAQARIQTGPAVPEWTWRSIDFGWNGPVAASQTIRPVLIPPIFQRILTLARVALLIALAWVLLRWRKEAKPPAIPPTGTAVAALFLAFILAGSQAVADEVPDVQTLDLLKSRLLQADPAFPGAAEIPSASVSIRENRVTVEAEIHAAAEVAVPLPGKLPTWTPLSVSVENAPSPAALMRRQGHLWVAVKPGVHRVRMEALLPNSPDWDLTFKLRPKTLRIDAPGWTVTGLRPDGIPEAQIFFTVTDRSGEREAAYDQNDFNPIVEVNRRIELGLVWQVQTTVRRLSPKGKAVSLRIPLLPGERVLTAKQTPENGRLEVALGANQDSVSWESELTVQDTLALSAEKTDRWVERWQLVASPVWNVAIDGLAPVFESNISDLIPVWHPWPGESVTLTVTRPKPVVGETMTIRTVGFENSLGAQHRTGKLTLDVHASLGNEFPITLPTDAEVTSLRLGDQPIPVRKEADSIVVPVHPGEQKIELAWTAPQALETRATSDTVTLPVESSNITATLNLPNDRWVLWTFGPLRGPAVRFWPILVVSVLAAFFLARLPLSPFRRWEWALLAIGFTQVPLPAALFLVAWLFLLSWRGHHAATKLSPATFNLVQVCLVFAALPVLLILLAILHRGLLGSPEMFILGNGSRRTTLVWFEARASLQLPEAGVFSISVWYYRGLMLLWALWLASSFLRWAPWGWQQFTAGGLWRKSPPPLPRDRSSG